MVESGSTLWVTLGTMNTIVATTVVLNCMKLKTKTKPQLLLLTLIKY
jgi:hypothetical protein